MTNIIMKHILILTTLLFALPNMLHPAERLPGQHVLPDAQYRPAGARRDTFHRRLRGVRGLFIDLRGAVKLRPIKGQKLRQMLESAKVEPELMSYMDDSAKNRLLFSNPASAPSPGQSRGDRVNMTVRLSYDEGRTWPVSKLLHDDPSAYSCLAVLPDGDIGCLYEGGETRYGKIVFARFSLEWLTDGKDFL